MVFSSKVPITNFFSRKWEVERSPKEIGNPLRQGKSNKPFFTAGVTHLLS